MVFGIVDHDVAVLVDHRRAEAPQHPVGPAGVADRMAEREARRVVGPLQRLAELEEAREVARHALEAGLVHPGLAVHHGAAGAAERNRDPLAVLVAAVVLGDREPAAVLLAEVAGEVVERQGLVGEQMRVLLPGEHDVRPAADVRRDRRLRPQVLPALAVDDHLDPGLLGELLGVLEEQGLVALDELRGAQHAQLGALLDRIARRRRRP